eukprot:SAG31_NODE_1286_length_9000_cov_2.244692_2_plen_95_part_00
MELLVNIRFDALMSEQEQVLQLIRPAIRVLDAQSCAIEEMRAQYEFLRQSYVQSLSTASPNPLTFRVSVFVYGCLTVEALPLGWCSRIEKCRKF